MTKRQFLLRAGAALAFGGCVAFFFGGCAAFLPGSANIRVGSYNIRYGAGDKNTANVWKARRADVAALIRKLDLDVFGLQEVLPEQADYLQEKLPEYAFLGDYREADRASGEASSVCFRKDRFTVLKGGTFWLSENPDEPGSKSWGTCCTRVCSWALLEDRRTKRRFCFANTHTDHVSAQARLNGTQLVIDRMREFGAGVPIVFTGDHNNTEIEEPAQRVAGRLKNALYQSETPPVGSWRTYNGWRYKEKEVSIAEACALPMNIRNIANNDMASIRKEGVHSAAARFYDLCQGVRIDYIWVSSDIRVRDYTTHCETRPGLKLYPSDHFPITATISLEQKGAE